MGLLQQSLATIKKYQTENGAFPAAPFFKPYQYCWLRDGSFIAYALELEGEDEAAEKFFHWCVSTLQKHLGKIERLTELHSAGVAPGHDDYLHTRYTITGEEGTEPWGNFQLDGYGIFLWALGQHWQKKRPSAEACMVAEKVADYLAEFWPVPCLDCWEEHGDHHHPSTLAAIAGGLKAVQPMLNRDYSALIKEIQQLLQEKFVKKEHFSKFQHFDQVDANLLWLAVPFELFSPDDILIKNTVTQIEKNLLTAGVHRYPGDSYYGGGEWILLTAWLAWYYLLAGEMEAAGKLLAWIERQADDQGLLPEQVPENMFVPEAYPGWVERWGRIASPLLWSHAMYIVAGKLYTK